MMEMTTSVSGLQAPMPDAGCKPAPLLNGVLVKRKRDVN